MNRKMRTKSVDYCAARGHWPGRTICLTFSPCTVNRRQLEYSTISKYHSSSTGSRHSQLVHVHPKGNASASESIWAVGLQQLRSRLGHSFDMDLWELINSARVLRADLAASTETPHPPPFLRFNWMRCWSQEFSSASTRPLNQCVDD